MKALLDGLDGILRKLLILHHKVMQVVSEIICASRPSVTVKDSKETNLGPLYIKVCLVFGF